MNVEMLISLFGSLLFCLLIGLPIGFSLMLCSVSIILIFDLVSLTALPATLFNSLNSFSLTAIAFFILAGNIMDRGQLMQSIINITRNFFSRIRGGLGIAMMVTCSVFAAMCGTSVASAAAMGNMGIPMMEKEGYPKSFSAAAIASGGTIGILIPPSLSFILIGNLISENISDLFIAGIIPGIIQTAILSLCVYVICKKKKYGKVGERQKVKKEDLKKGIWALLMPVIVLGGIYSGIFTPTEAAAVSVLYALVVVLFIYKAVNWKSLKKIVLDSAKMTSNLLVILAGASLFGLVLTYSRLPQQLVSLVETANVPKWLFFVLMTMIMFILGCIMDGTTQTVIAVPILWPIAQSFGINPLAFAVYVVATVELATLTPPVGMNLFVVTGISKEPIGRVVKELVPFFVAQLITIFIFAICPQISTFLVGLK